MQAVHHRLGHLEALEDHRYQEWRITWEVGGMVLPSNNSHLVDLLAQVVQWVVAAWAPLRRGVHLLFKLLTTLMDLRIHPTLTDLLPPRILLKEGQCEAPRLPILEHPTMHIKDSLTRAHLEDLRRKECREGLLEDLLGQWKAGDRECQGDH